MATAAVCLVLFAVGGLLKGTLWETTAVPELRSQAFRLAETIAGELSENAAAASPIASRVKRPRRHGTLCHLPFPYIQGTQSHSICAPSGLMMSLK